MKAKDPMLKILPILIVVISTWIYFSESRKVTIQSISNGIPNSHKLVDVKQAFEINEQFNISFQSIEIDSLEYLKTPNGYILKKGDYVSTALSEIIGGIDTINIINQRDSIVYLSDSIKVKLADENFKMLNTLKSYSVKSIRKWGRRKSAIILSFKDDYFLGDCITHESPFRFKLKIISRLKNEWCILEPE